MAFDKIWVILSIICSMSLPTFAQQFKYTAALDKIKEAGFYAIPISPELSAYTRTDFADIRIADNKKQWVPHILKPAITPASGEMFTEFPILLNTVTDSGKNLLIVKNTKAGGIDNLKVFLKNAAVNRTAVVSGSNDQHNWYIIDDNIPIGRSNETTQDEYLQEIIFPMAKYTFLKIVIDNSHNDPLLITRIGYFARTFSDRPVMEQENPTPFYSQKDSNNRSYIEVRQNALYQFDRVLLNVTGSKFYSRDVSIYLPTNTRIRAAKHPIELGSFKLMSALPAIFELPRTKALLFFIVINNGDNPPLKIEKVILQQQPVSLIAYLEENKNYNLVFGDSLASFPDYDLQIFKDSIKMPQTLNYGKVKSLKRDGDAKAASGNWWIWCSIILAGMLLSFLTFRLISDINNPHDG
ncbi:MAG: hypothetical protein JWQ09_6033 [Segetibacter sp.]|nr:hypothetical protein [Segetibacter sp.]